MNHRDTNLVVVYPTRSSVLLLLALLLGVPASWAQNGLVGRWTFDRTNITGTVVKDQAGTLNGEIVGPIAFASGPDALVLDGSQNYVRLAAAMDTAKLPAQNLTAEAWVALRSPAEWGGIVGCVQDNGSFERGWLLGYRQSSFSMTVSATGTLTYMAAATSFTLNRWYYVVGTYDGATIKLYVNGQLAASSTAQHGPILYAPAPYVIGAYQDDNEFFAMDGYLREVNVYDRALTAAEVLDRYNQQKNAFPATPGPIVPVAATPVPTIGPFVRFTGPDSALAQWETATDSASILEWGETAALGTRETDSTPKCVHALALKPLKPKTKYFYVVKQVIEGEEVASAVGDFETDFNFTVPPLPDAPSPFPDDALNQWCASVAAGILAETGVTKGYCLDFGCGDGRLAYELARRSELHVVGVSADAAAVRIARQALRGVGAYGARVTISQSSLQKLPHTKNSFNLVVSSAVLRGEGVPGAGSEAWRVLRPAGGVAFFGLPPGVAGALPQWAALEQWVRTSFPTNSVTTQFESDRMMKVISKALPGAGEWSHAYGDPGQTACSHDRRVAGPGTKLQWFGEPGPRGMTDRQPRNPPPLTVNGFLYVQGNNRVCAQDVYNGCIYWSLEIPGLRRVNLPRDTGNMCADDGSLYLAVRDACWRLEARTGQLRQHYAVQSPNTSPSYDWGYVASVGERLYGSSVKRGSFYTAFDGGPFWYDTTGTESTAKVCSANLFCLEKDAGVKVWNYARGVIVNSSIAIGGGRVYFIESRNPALASQSTGRIASGDLWKNNYLVTLDAGTGSLLWEKALTLPSSPYPMALFLCYADEKLVLCDSSSLYNLYGYSAADGTRLWSKAHAWSRDNHGGHIYHPILVKGRVIVEPNGYDLTTGSLVYTGLPSRGGCSTMAAAANTLHYINWDYDKGALYLWDLDTNQRRQLAGPRGNCWIGVVSGGGMTLLPAVSAGCTCRYPIQTSIGFAAP